MKSPQKNYLEIIKSLAKGREIKKHWTKKGLSEGWDIKSARINSWGLKAIKYKMTNFDE